MKGASRAFYLGMHHADAHACVSSGFKHPSSVYVYLLHMVLKEARTWTMDITRSRAQEEKKRSATWLLGCWASKPV